MDNQQTSEGQGLAIIAAVFAFVSIVILAFAGWPVSITSLLGAVLSIMAYREAKKGFGPKKLTSIVMTIAIIVALVCLPKGIIKTMDHYNFKKGNPTIFFYKGNNTSEENNE